MSDKRNIAVDIIKLIAAFGVIIIHLPPPAYGAHYLPGFFNLFVVPYFLVISIYFFLNRLKTLHSPRWVDFRFDRILVPYATWTVVYLLMRFTKSRFTGERLDLDPIGVVFYGQAAVQLYFVPLLLLCQALAVILIFWLRAPKWKLIGSLIAIGAIAFGYFASAKGYLHFDDCLQRSIAYALLALLLVKTQNISLGRRANVIIGALTVAVVCLFVFYPHLSKGLGLLRGPLIGYGVAALALNLHCATASPFLIRLLSCSFGIYLAHHGFLEGYKFLSGKLHWSPNPDLILNQLLLGTLFFCCCVVSIFTARWHWLTSYLFLGEKMKSSEQNRNPPGHL